MTEVSVEKDFFISYTAVDVSWAKWIGWVLENAGYSVVLQAWDFPPASNFMHKMDQGLQQSGRTVLVLSEDCLKSKWTRWEQYATQVADPLGEKGKLVPIRVRECKLPPSLVAVVNVDVVGVTENEAREKILQAIGASEGASSDSRHNRPPFPGVVSSSGKESSNDAVARASNEMSNSQKASLIQQ